MALHGRAWSSAMRAPAQLSGPGMALLSSFEEDPEIPAKTTAGSPCPCLHPPMPSIRLQESCSPRHLHPPPGGEVGVGELVNG